jgi:DNA-binding response OmpR family regulator
MTAMSSKSKIDRVLIVDDNLDMAQCLADMVDEFGVASEIVADGDEAIRRLDKQRFSLVIADTQMPTVSGFTLLKHVKKNHPDTPVAIMSTRNSEVTQGIVARDRADFYLPKPLSTADVGGLLREVADRGGKTSRSPK